MPLFTGLTQSFIPLTIFFVHAPYTKPLKCSREIHNRCPFTHSSNKCLLQTDLSWAQWWVLHIPRCLKGIACLTGETEKLASYRDQCAMSVLEDRVVGQWKKSCLGGNQRRFPGGHLKCVMNECQLTRQVVEGVGRQFRPTAYKMQKESPDQFQYGLSPKLVFCVPKTPLPEILLPWLCKS